MKFRDYLNEAKSPEEHAKDRFWSFSKKANGDDEKLSRMIRLRTKKTNNLQKLKAWFDVLEDQNYHDEASEVHVKIKKMGGKI